MYNQIVKLIKNRMIQDMLLNITATAVPIAILQLVVYPIIAKSLSGDTYGFMLTIYSILIMIPNSLGAVLNNIRLLYNGKYEDPKEIGDFALLYRRWNGVSAIVLFIVIWIYCGTFSIIHIGLGIITGSALLTRIYLEVGFRLEFNYKRILFCNLFQSMGFLLGCYLAYLTGVWEFIYLLGYCFGAIYAVRKTSLLSEHPAKSPLYTDVKKDSHSLLISVMINSLVGYADKLVLFPLMGGMAVSIYYTATILGKILSMLTTPINGVILNYIANWENDSKNVFGKALISTTLMALAGYVVTILISRPVIGLLFPQWVDEVMLYIPITTITVMINLVSSVLQPFVMKFCRMEWQTIVNCVATFFYFFSSLLLWRINGLTGFCVGTVIGALVKVILLISVYYYYKNRKDNKK